MVELPDRAMCAPRGHGGAERRGRRRNLLRLSALLVERRCALESIEPVARALFAAAVAPSLLDAESCVRRAARLCGGARRHGGDANRCLAGEPVARDRLRLPVVLSAVLARGYEPFGAAALAGSQYGSGRRTVDQGRPRQHG